MSEWKEVWYVWDGSSPIKHGRETIKSMVNRLGQKKNPKQTIMFNHQGFGAGGEIVAYTLGEKRRVCGECTGSGKSFEDDDVLGDTCQFCIGTGWEYKK